MKRSPLLLLAISSIALIAACGDSGTGSTATQPGQAAAGGGGDTTGGTGEGPSLRYTNTRFHYRIDAPGAMKEAADGSAAFLGIADRLEITVVTGASAADPHALGAADLKTLGAKPSFKVTSQLAQVNLGGRTIQKVVYTWTDGVNQVTSKPNDLVSARYYIPKDGGTVAVVQYSIAANQYDPQGADDIVNTFAWL